MTEAEKIFKAIEAFVDKRLKDANDKITSLESQLKAGLELAQKAVSDVELKEGLPGKSVTIEDVQPIIDSAIKTIEQNIKLPEIDYDKINKAIAEQVSKIEVKHGKDAVVDYEEIGRFIGEEVDKIEVKNGEDAVVDYEKIELQIEKKVREEISKIEIKEGEDGLDALEIEIQPAIHPAKTYHRGTYASHEGGLWRSFKQTKGMDGWECIIDGVSGVEIDQNERDVAIKVKMASGKEEVKSFEMPAVIYRGVWREGEYKKNDSVTLSGSLYIANENTEERPGEGSKAWFLSCKKGGTGKSAYDIARQAGFEGTKEQWLDSLGKKARVKI